MRRAMKGGGVAAHDHSSGWREFDSETTPPTTMYHLINALVVPRPIAWVSTIGANGVANYAPYSYFTILCADPPSVCFSSVGEKGTLRNVRFTKDFVVNVVSDSLAAAMHLTAADVPPGESEFAWAGLTPLPTERVRAPRLAEAPSSLECRRPQILEVGRTPSNVVVGDVVAVHVAESALRDGRVDVRLHRPLGRPSGSGYVAPGAFFD